MIRRNPNQNFEARYRADISGIFGIHYDTFPDRNQNLELLKSNNKGRFRINDLARIESDLKQIYRDVINRKRLGNLNITNLQDKNKNKNNETSTEIDSNNLTPNLSSTANSNSESNLIFENSQ